MNQRAELDPPPPTVTDRRVMAVIAAIALHFAILWIGTWLGNVLHVSPNGGAFLLLITSLLMAWCSLAAIWWVHAPWPSHFRTLAVILLSVIAWAVHLGVRRAPFGSDESAAWAASVLTQIIVTILAMLALQRIRGTGIDRPRQFSILYLLIWTTVVALLLGAGRLAAIELDWTTAVFRWRFFFQIQVAGVMSALLAVCVWTSFQSGRTLKTKLLACGISALSLMLVANLLFSAIFRDVGATALGIGWLYGSQMSFILAILLPLHELRRHKLEAMQRGRNQTESSVPVTSELTFSRANEN